jgi:site-specific recombinase XerD
MNVKILLEKLSNEIKLRNLSHDTHKNYCYNVKTYLRWCLIHKITISNNSMRTYFLELEKKYDINTIKSIRAAIKFLLIHVLKREINNFPIFEIKTKSKKLLPKVLSKEEITFLLNSIKNKKHHLMISLLYCSGLRLSELINVKREHLNLNDNTILVSQGKGKKDRISILSQKFKADILDYLTTTQFTTKYLFESNRKTKYTKKTIQVILEKASKNINKHVTPHMIRHTFATHLLESNIDIRYIQKLLGHSKLETTSIYTYVANNKLNLIKSPHDQI